MDAPIRRPSMADVAARAGVSYQTVSRVLNEPQIVRPATRERVLEAIAALGYTRNRAARALKTTRSSLIGMLTDGSSLFGPAETTTAIESAAREAGYSVLLTTVDAHEDGAREIGSELLGSGADGILVVAAHEGMVPAVATAARSTPVIAVSAQAPKVPGVEVVGVDQQLGARQIVEHLVRTGARSIVHLCGPQDWFDARARLDGFRQAAGGLGLEATVAGPGDWTPRTGYELTNALVAEGTLPEAIFAANDMMAIGVLHALDAHGLRVPEDVAVAGFDNTVGAEFLIPSLTTVSQPFAELGRLALERLLCLLEGREVPSDTPHTLPPRLVARRSTRPERTH
ncbi:LacI family DNA-binding transcriptional regulator [Brachybacterium sacelli]|uniref:DNA-binding LacI/PurR family transcriptional regulator n=2 Tax=Brachybacterium sacelli TaxID=173364 RepID=A0ABS4WVY6_9MICO|nr:LacI family DNA-binding transcriptional regulator [Brachybacterium sacelli]MBP2380377.1 DNA-binding LacI/PurR family transcriptional regulator [Brachybacterium sacelli]